MKYAPILVATAAAAAGAAAPANTNKPRERQQGRCTAHRALWNELGRRFSPPKRKKQNSLRHNKGRTCTGSGPDATFYFKMYRYYYHKRSDKCAGIRVVESGGRLRGHSSTRRWASAQPRVRNGRRRSRSCGRSGSIRAQPSVHDDDADGVTSARAAALGGLRERRRLLLRVCRT